jgi:two-component system chemotaxis response regulator CheB
MHKRVEVIAIGCSTGGPNALAKLLPKLHGHVNHVPILITQHGAGIFTSSLAEQLERVSHIPTVAPAHGEVIEPGKIYLAPARQHLTVERRDGQVVCHLNNGPKEHHFKPAVDVMLRSVAEVYRQHALAIILTGMGKDGLEGCRQIAEQKGRIIVQDKSTSVVWGMPGAVSHAGLGAVAVPLPLIADTILRFIKHPALMV